MEFLDVVIYSEFILSLVAQTPNIKLTNHVTGSLPIIALVASHFLLTEICIIPRFFLEVIECLLSGHSSVVKSAVHYQAKGAPDLRNEILIKALVDSSV